MDKKELTLAFPADVDALQFAQQLMAAWSLVSTPGMKPLEVKGVKIEFDYPETEEKSRK